MAAPRVNIIEDDRAGRIEGSPGPYGAIVIPTLKGDSSAPFLCTSQSDFLDKATPNGKVEVGSSMGHFSALAYLEKADKLWVSRAVPSDAEYGKVYVQTDGVIRVPSNDTGEDPDWEADDLFMVRGSSVGAWNSDLAIKIYVDHPLVTIDQDEDAVSLVTGAFTVASHEFTTGEKVSLHGSDLPTGLLTTRTYYVSSSSTPTTIILSSSTANAIDGVDIIPTVVGSGNISIRPVNAVDEPVEAEAFQLEIYYKGQLVETHICSRKKDQLNGYGRNLFLETSLERSAYVRGALCPLNEGAIPLANLIGADFSTATDGTTVNDGDMIAAAQKLLDKETYPITYFMDGGWSTAGFHAAVDSICQQRQDCFGILSAPSTASGAEELVEFRQLESNINSSWSGLFAPYVKMTDRFNNRKLFTSPDGYVAAAYAASSETYEPWYLVAGYQRGVLPVEDVDIRFAESDLDYLYDNGINPIRFKKGHGCMIWGQKTLQKRPSPLDRINVRMLLLTIAPEIAESLEANDLFELNDDTTRNRVALRLRVFMDNIKARRGVISYRVVVDRTNNLSDDIDNGRMNAWIFIVPAVGVEEINLRLILESNSVSFAIGNADL